MANWEDWIRERIHWNGFEIVPRSTCIRIFVKDGLVPFLRKKGYRLAVSEKEFANQIANGLFDSAGKSTVATRWNVQARNTDCKIEDVWHWSHVLDDDVWEEFWSIWGHWEDVSLDSYRGQDRRIDIRWHVWTQIDLANSPEWIAQNEEDEAESPKERRTTAARADDTYLREAVESGQYDGWRR
jgi:hypothetical protein